MKSTKIQWASGTVNPVVGCLGCELFPRPSEVLKAVDAAMAIMIPSWRQGDARTAYADEINATFAALAPKVEGTTAAVTTTNIAHVTPRLAAKLDDKYGPDAGTALRETIQKIIVCYAAILHLNRGASIAAPDRQINPGYAAQFEKLRLFPGRAMAAARWGDLHGLTEPAKPWAEGLPRLIFVGDMGDTFARRSDFDFIASDVMPAITSDAGQRLLWLLLTKRPRNMAEFARVHGAFPENVCCLTTVTSEDTIDRLNDLREVDCSMRGVSAEPLWSRLASDSVNLEGIDWFIVGGASGARKAAKPFNLAWARELREHCRAVGVAYFVKHLGSNPIADGVRVECSDRHGGNWDEWPDDLRIREFPEKFYEYRSMKATKP